MRYIERSVTSENYDFIIQNSFTVPIYVDKFNKDVKIKIKVYNPRFSYFGAINIFQNSIFLFSELSEYFDVPLYMRINSDNYKFYDIINLYLYKVKDNYNIYIKKLYGRNDFYECNVDEDSIDKNDLSILTKPISDCKNKKSILNTIYNLDGTKIITGYLGPNSYYDLYLDFDNKDYIDMSIL